MDLRAHWQMLESANEQGLDELWLASDLDVLQPRGELSEKRADLHARKLSSQAEVDSVTKREVAIGVTTDIEPVGVIEYFLVEVGTRIGQKHRVVGGHPLSPDLSVFGRYPHKGFHGRGPTDHLLGGKRNQPRIAPQPLNLVWGLDERANAAGNGCSRCVVPGGCENAEVAEELRNW